MTSCPNSLVTKEMKIRTTMRYLLEPVRTATIKAAETTSVEEDMGKLEYLCTAGGNLKSCGSCGKQPGNSSIR